MATTNTGIDPLLCIAWSLGHAILTALVSHTAVNADITFDAILTYLSRGGGEVRRWVGRCKTCNKAHRVDGEVVRGRERGRDYQIVVSGTRCYLTADQGSNSTALTISCCDRRVKLGRVYDSAKPNRPRHECNAKCLGSTGPACECKCGGKNHGAGAKAA